MDIATGSFVSMMPDGATGVMPSAPERMARLLDEIATADRAGVDVFGDGSIIAPTSPMPPRPSSSRPPRRRPRESD